MKVLAKVLFVIYIFQNCNYINSQESIELSFESGIGSYKMNDLKEINQKIYSSLPFNAKIVSDYPGYLYYKISPILVLNNNLHFGLTYSYNSTGSRISTADYSGSYKFDTRIQSNSYGFKVDFHYSLFYNISLGLGGEIGYIGDKFNYNYYFEIGEFKNKQDQSYRSSHKYFEPQFCISYQYQFIKTGINIGYLRQFSSENLSNSDFYKTYFNYAQANWNGFRYGIFVALVYEFKRK